MTFKNLTIQQSSNYILDGLADYGMTVNITGVVVKNFHWAGVRNESTYTITITSSTLSNNGSAYYADAGGVLSLASSTVSNNSGWGIDENGGSVTVTGTTISGNGGGGIYMGYADNASLDMTGSVVSGNGLSHPPQYGGGLCNLTHSNVDHTAFEGNSASWGGGIYSSGQLFLTNSTLGGNSAVTGGGLFVDFVTANNGLSRYLEGYNNTLAFNTASQGGGMNLYGSGSGNTTAMACVIVANNTAPTGPDVSGNMANTSLGFLVTTASGAAHLPSPWIVANPKLGVYSSTYKTYPLLSGSPALGICSNGDLADYGAF